MSCSVESGSRLFAGPILLSNTAGKDQREQGHVGQCLVNGCVDVLQQLVAAQVPEAVVDGLEVVDVESAA